MNHFKVSNRKIYTDKRSSIENLHENKLSSIISKEENLPNMKKKLKQLNDLLEILSSTNGNTGKKQEIQIEINTLEKEISRIQNNDELIDYIYNALPFIEKFNSNNNEIENKELDNTITKNTTESELDLDSKNELKLDSINKKEDTQNMLNFFNMTGKTNKGSDYQKYIDVCFNNKCYFEDEKINNECKLCKNTKFEYDYRHAVKICNNCGSCTTFIEFNENSLSYSDIAQLDNTQQLYSYQRKNHFKEWLYQLQAKEVTQIPETVIELLSLEIKKERITSIDEITSERIKKYLKKLRLNKYYEHIPNIINKITNKPALKINAELENKLLELFDKIQEPFDKYCPKNRKNFLNYSYTIHKFCQLLEKDEYLVYFPLLKSREKLFEQEKIWKNICKELGWKFIASV